ncbi:hypothetical protein B0I37DRAFT_389954 [Chaetomium sp. MPI-CAGE-AT-0009]|nr:hypothetical protein B0I37DRAFT_389954 [Chaetomium sp. MPI-CAGE-AT-0009]
MQQSRSGKRAYLFHGACWDLLEKALSPTPVPLLRLFDVCKSQPIPLRSGALHWGHDYGGATVVDRRNYFPWEDGVEDRPGGFPTPDPVFHSDPYHIPEIAGILTEEPSGPPAAPARDSSITVPAQGPGADCFARIPMELRTAIAMHLPTADVLNARLASRAFQPIFNNQQFWASRFHNTASDRGWLVDAHQKTKANHPRDWRWLYHLTNTPHLNLNPGLRNRQRIWSLIQALLPILDRVWVPVPRDPGPAWSLNLNEAAHPTTARWLGVSGHVWRVADQGDGLWTAFYRGCRSFRHAEIAVPRDLARLAVSTVGVGGEEYIAGLVLETDAGDAIRFGYHAAGSSSSPEQSVRVSRLLGFCVAVGVRGVQGLQCIAGPEGMVSLAICVDSPPDGGPEHETNLRNSALWHPDVPGPALQLNEESFFPLRARFVSELSYKPLFWCHFGGPGGKYLPHLTRVSATSGDGTRRIRFFFDLKVPTEHRALGRLADLRVREGQNVEFPVDGPGGERIVAVEMGHQFFLHESREVMSHL